MCLFMLAPVGCATTASTDARDEIIKHRAQARWEALLARDYAAAYTFASPGYRSANSVADFEIDVRSRRVQYVSAAYQDHSCNEAVCTVRVQVGYKVVRPAAGVSEWKSKSVIAERWINTDGNWWYLPEKR